MGVSGDSARLLALADELRSLAEWADDGLADDVAETGLELVHGHFKSGSGPDGAAWAPVLRGGSPLVDTGELEDSFTVYTFGRGFSLESSITWAGVHNEGAVIQARTPRGLRFQVAGRWATKQSVRIPARPFVPSPTGALPSLWAEAVEARVEMRLAWVQR